MIHFALINQSKHIRPLEMQLMASVATRLANTQFCPVWGIERVSAGTYDNIAHVPLGSIIVGFTDHTEDAEAYGWHDEKKGLPIVVDQVMPVLDQGGGILKDNGTGLSVSGTWCHEMFETLVDPLINDWVLMEDGRFLAKEACDPVQAHVLKERLGSDDILLSNAVLPSYFDVNGKAPFDLMKLLKQPFELAPEGYWIVWDNGKTTDVWGEKVPEAVRKMKQRKAGRSSHRRSK